MQMVRPGSHASEIGQDRFLVHSVRPAARAIPASPKKRDGESPLRAGCGELTHPRMSTVAIDPLAV